MSETTDTPNTPSLADRLGDVTVGLREDLEVSRHVFRGEPSYIVRDPMTFQTQRIAAADYQIFVGIHPDRRLADTFDDLVARGKLESANEAEFYEFIMSLHRLGFLQLPVVDHKNLYRRYRVKNQAARTSRIKGFLFLRIPLWNPDEFLNRTIHLARPLFTKAAFIVWCVTMTAAGLVAFKHRHELAGSLSGLLAGRNILIMWATLIVLKVFHEFGHAYACKRFHGYVPEMGAYMIMFTPCAYVDATASWGFTRKRDRIIVCLAGMYIESFIAALGVFVWAMAGSSMLQGIAYNVIFLASIVTVLFNVNPLMRYDGYYMFSDLVEVPNLRARATAYVSSILKRCALGIRTRSETAGRRLHIILFTYGVASSIYRVALVTGISILLASKMFIVGLALAVFFLGGFVVGTVKRLGSYVLHAEETAPVRVRAIVVSVAATALLVTGLLFVPLPSAVKAQGLVRYEHERVVRLKTDATLVSSSVRDGQQVRQDQPLAVFEDDSTLEGVAVAEANLRLSTVRHDAYLLSQPALARQERDRAVFHRFALERARRQQQELTVGAPTAGRVIGCVEESAISQFMQRGTPIATIGSGRWLVQAIISADDMRAARPVNGDRVTFRPAVAPGRTLQGVVTRISPAGSRHVRLAPLTHLAGGDVAVEPSTQNAVEPYFEVDITLDEESQGLLRAGSRGMLLFQSRSDTALRAVSRRLKRFFNKLGLD